MRERWGSTKQRLLSLEARAKQAAQADVLSKVEHVLRGEIRQHHKELTVGLKSFGKKIDVIEKYIQAEKTTDATVRKISGWVFTFLLAVMAGSGGLIYDWIKEDENLDKARQARKEAVTKSLTDLSKNIELLEIRINQRDKESHENRMREMEFHKQMAVRLQRHERLIDELRE
jgi:hypothetical protein